MKVNDSAFENKAHRIWLTIQWLTVDDIKIPNHGKNKQKMNTNDT